MKKSAILILLAVSIFLVSISTTLAWFANISYIDNDDLKASVIPGYFGGGDGSASNPFIISAPRHLYNLAWLQYLGKLNERVTKDGKEGLTQYYFQVKDTTTSNGANGVLDMKGLIIPPIGTTEYPFIGHFDGNGCTIKDLTVSNYLSTNTKDSGIVERPLSVTTIDEATTSIVGFFGVVGDYDGTLTKAGLIVSEAAGENNSVDVRSRVNSVHDLFLEDITVRTESTTSLIGLLAGYVNGSVGNVGIGTSAIELGANVKPLTDAEATEVSQIISAYSLIGQCGDDILFWDDVLAPGWGTGNGGGTGAGWGGSINFLELRKRVAYIVGAVGTTKTSGDANYPYLINSFGYHGRFSSNQPWGTNNYTNRNARAVFLEDTVMPLSVDTDALKLDEVPARNEITYGQSSYTFDTTDYYLNNVAQNIEPVLSTNSAYLVGGGDTYDNAYIYFLPDNPCGYASGSIISGVGIYKSLGTSINKNTPFPTDVANSVFHMLTIDVAGNTKLIQDEYNTTNFASAPVNKTGTHLASVYNNAGAKYTSLGFTKYVVGYDGTTKTDSGVRTAFLNANKGENIMQGILFRSKINMTNNNPEKTSVNVTLMGNKLSNYEMITGAINFKLGEAGTLTTIAGTYQRYGDTANNINASIVHTLFRLIKVDRDPDTNEIDNCYLINTVHQKLYKLDEGEELYVYNLQTEDPTRYAKVYDYNEMSSLTEVGAAYYFEIPLNAGDYAIGLTTEDSDKFGAVLLYLDIGANGAQQEQEQPDMEASHAITGVTFVNVNSLATVKYEIPGTIYTKEVKSTNGYSIVNCEIKLNKGVTTHTGLAVTFQRASKDADVVSAQTGDPTKFTFTWTEAENTNTETAALDQIVLAYPRKREDTA